MRVLRCYLALPPSPGGMERHIAELSRHQRGLGVNVVQAFTVGQLESAHGFRVLGGWNVLHMWPHALRDGLFYLAVCWKAWRLKLTVDVVHVHGDWSAFLLGSILKRVVSARVLLCSMHGHMPSSWGRRWLYRISLRCSDAGYATGRREADRLSSLGRHSWKHITSGVDESCFVSKTYAERPSDVVVVGSLLPVKGIDLAIEVARLLPHRQFRIVGDGPERNRLATSAAGLSNVIFVGSLPQKSVVQEYAAARVLLSTSLREGTPTVMLEAMAAGLPVVTTRSNQLDELLGNGEGGIVEPSRDAMRIAAAVERLLSEPGRWASASCRNILEARTYSWPAIAGRVTELMTDALGAVDARSSV